MTDAAAPETQPTAVVVDFSTEELTYVLEMLGVDKIPGFSVTQELDELTRSVVRNSLTAHGFIARNIDGDWVMNDFVRAAVTAGLRATRYLTLRRDASPEFEDWLYILNGVVVEYIRPADYLHRFQIIFTPEGLAEALAILLELAPPETIEPLTLTFPVSLLDVRRLARQGHVDAANEAADSYDLPESLRAALISPLQYTAFSATSLQDDQPVVTGGIAISSPRVGEYWIITPVNDQVRVEKTDSTEVLLRVGDLMQP